MDKKTKNELLTEKDVIALMSIAGEELNAWRKGRDPETTDSSAAPTAPDIPPDFNRPECVFNYCPHPKLCQWACMVNEAETAPPKSITHCIHGVGFPGDCKECLAEPESGVIWIDPRTKEPCRRCDGTGEMPPWPGSKGLVRCGVCRAEERPVVAPSPIPHKTKAKQPINYWE